MVSTKYTLNGQTFGKYIAVYIDGDSLAVQDELMKRGFEGGIEAAQNLRRHIVECLGQMTVHSTRDLGIVIYVYADFQELAARYLNSRLPEAAETVREFCQGFNSAHPWSCYDDMTMSSRKRYLLRESFLQQLSSEDCVHIAFVKPTNAVFQALIDDRRKFFNMDKKIRAIPLPAVIFRSEEKTMVARPMEMQVHPPPPELFLPSEKSQMLDVFRKASSPTMRYPGKVDHTGTKGKSSKSAVLEGSSTFTIPRNIHDQRIDPLTHASQELVNSVKTKNICKDVRLRGRCGRKHCQFSHDDLTEPELDALTQYARQRPCRDENKCLNPTCYWGHMCPWGSKCDRSRCQFDTHVIDFQVHHYVHQKTH